VTCADPDLALLVFTRAPIPGKAKSRLIARFGAGFAASLQQRMSEQMLDAAVRSEVGAVSLWCSPSVKHPFFAACRRTYGVALYTQRGADLGERLRHAHERMFASYRALLIVGTDCPALTTEHLRAAREELRDHDAVVVPAEDGGYVLLGLRRPCLQAFEAITWSSDRVLDQTLERLRRAGHSFRLLPSLWDVDRPEDVFRLQACRPELLAGLRYPHEPRG
jgi:rSAM/selenodomain-associated transferase 1